MAVEILKKWDGTLEVGKNDTGYYSFDEVLEFFNIGPARMEYYLKEYKDVIVPIYNNDGDILNSKYHWIEVKELNDIIMKKHKDEKYWEKFCKSLLDESTDSPQEYDSMKSRIVELEAELVSFKDDNVRLMDEIEELKKNAQSDGVVEKSLGSRERKTLLKIMRACLDERKQPIERGLAGKLARRIEDLYGDEGPNEDTIKIKLNEMEKIPTYNS